MLRGPLRLLTFLLGIVALVLGGIGVVVPGLPTTSFILLAAWAFARSSRRFDRWLLSHRMFGPMIRNWRATGAISLRARVSAAILMGIALVVFQLTMNSIVLTAGLALVLVLVSLYIWTRPYPDSGAARGDDPELSNRAG